MGLLGLLNIKGFQEGLQHWEGQGGPSIMKRHGGPKDLKGPEARDTLEAWEAKEAQLHREPINKLLPLRELYPN